MDLIMSDVYILTLCCLSELLVKRKSNFLRKFNSCYSLSFWLWEMCEMCVTIIYFLLVKLIKFFPLSFYIYC